MPHPFKLRPASIIVVSLISAFSITCVLHAQEAPHPKEDNSLRKNHLSFDPILPLFDTWQLQYERPILPRVSVSLTAGYKFSSGILNTDEISIDDFQMEEFGVSGIKLITEVRWYWNRKDKGIFGFYSGAYYRYQGRAGDIAGDYTDTSGEVSPILIEADLRTSNWGLEIGYKMDLGKGFFVDFIIAGPGLTHNRLELTEVNPVPQAFYDDINESLEDFGIPRLLGDNIEVSANQSTTYTTIAFRYGIKIGYAF